MRTVAITANAAVAVPAQKTKGAWPSFFLQLEVHSVTSICLALATVGCPVAFRMVECKELWNIQTTAGTLAAVGLDHFQLEGVTVLLVVGGDVGLVLRPPSRLSFLVPLRILGSPPDLGLF